MLRREQKGWLGIDLGTATVKVAQLARAEGRTRVLATAQVPRSVHPQEEGEGNDEHLWSAAGEIQAAVSLCDSFRGRHAAVSMPMSLCDVHQLGSLTGDFPDLDTEIRDAIETITQCSADHLEFDLWPADLENQQRWNVLAVARPWTDRIYQDVVESGCACHTIDGIPQALARAVNLTSAADTLPPVAILDWGFSQATFCLVANSQPIYVRTLKDCSLEALLSAVAGELVVTLDEAALLLRKYGTRGLNSNSPDEVSGLIAELVAEPVRQLEFELSKTISHVATQHRTFTPRQLLLFGGGALIGGLPLHLTRRLRLETQVWSFDRLRGEATQLDPLFGVAMALSALAWEGK